MASREHASYEVAEKRICAVYLMASSCQLSTSFSDIFFLKSPFFWMLRLPAAKFSRSVRVPADSVEWMLADTERVEPADTGA